MRLEPSAVTARRALEEIEDIERTPLRERLAADTAYDLLARAAAERPDAVALLNLPTGRAADQPEPTRYRDLMAAINRTANLAHALGVRPGQAVSILLPNVPAAHAVLWGAEAAGVANPINSLLHPDQIADIARAAGSRVLFAHGPDGRSDIWAKTLAVASRLGPDARVVQVGGAPQAGYVNFHSEIELQDSGRLISGRRIVPDDDAAYLHTGGTTGAPKLARHTHRAQAYEAWIAGPYVAIGPGSRLLMGLPLFHANAILLGGLGPLSAGATVVLAGPDGYRQKATVADFWRLVERHRITHFNAVPTLYAALLDVPLEGRDLSSVVFGSCGAAPMPLPVLEAFERATGIRVVEGYGLTEGTAVSTLNPVAGERRPGSVGLRCPYQELRVVGAASGRDSVAAPTGAVGRVAIRGPNVFVGYVDPAQGHHAWLDDGWLDTGDLGRLDADGYLWLTGRAKDIIIRGGHNIDPAVIESALLDHPEVLLAAAVGMPDAHAGQLPVGVVQLREGARASTDALLEFARGRIAERAAVPVELHAIARMPVTAVGKIYKLGLREFAERRGLERALAAVGGDAEVEFLGDAGPERWAVRVPPGAAVGRDQVADVVGRLPLTCRVEPGAPDKEG